MTTIRERTGAYRLLAVLALLALLTTGCDSAATETAGQTAGQASSGGGTGASDGTAATGGASGVGSASEPGGGATAGEAAGGGGGDGELTVTWGTPAGSVYDPHVSSNPFVYPFLYPFLYPAYDRLVRLDEDGEPQPMLAESFEFDEGNTALTLTLREGVTFHDGAPFDAEAVAANLERARTLENSTVRADLAAVEAVEVVDERHRADQPVLAVGGAAGAARRPRRDDDQPDGLRQPGPSTSFPWAPARTG